MYLDTIREFIKEHRMLILGIELLIITTMGVSFIWGATTQLDLMCVKPFMEYYSPDATWEFPFFGGWYSVSWTVYDSYVRMFWAIGIGAVILLFGMFYVGYRFGATRTEARLKRE